MIIKYLNNTIITICLLLCSINTNAMKTESYNTYEISILSIGEGPSLVDAFGHTAIRVKGDDLEKLGLKNDIVFNFDLNEKTTFLSESMNYLNSFIKQKK